MAYREAIGRDNRDACRKPSTTVSNSLKRLSVHIFTAENADLEIMVVYCDVLN